MKMEPAPSPRFAFVLLLLACWIAAEGAEHLKYKDPKQPLYVRIEDLLSRMTLTEKIGQMAQIEQRNASSEVMKNYFIGSVLSEAGSAPAPKASAKVWVDMVNKIQRAALSSRLGIPVIYGIDAVHGHNTVYKATIFPHNIGLGATRDPALVKKIGAATALEVRATGIPYTFAPCIAVCRDPRWGRCYESYSEDPKVVQEMTEIIPGLQGDIPKNSLKGVPFVGGKETNYFAAKDGGHPYIISWNYILLLCWVSTGDAEYMKYKDPEQPVGVRIKDLMNRMTLAEKIGQMTQIERKVATSEAMKDSFIGSVLSGGGSVPAPKASAKDWIDMINSIQAGALSTRLGIPMLYAIDAVHGNNNVYNATIFPHNIGLGATRDPDLVKRIGSATALEVRATGIPYAFAPCIAVCRDPRWGRCYESYSEDHTIVQAMTAIIPGLQGDLPANQIKGTPYVASKDKVAACAKHFVGDGGTQKGLDENNTIIDRRDLFSIHMPAYYNSISEGVSTIMVSYSSWNGEKMHANRDLITGFLKNTLHFKGLVISDWQGIDRITSPPGANYTYSVQAGVNAGIDMVMIPYDYDSFIKDLTALVNANSVPMSRIDDAVSRILYLKFSVGLFENPYADLSLADQVGKKEHRELAREAVRKSLVLLKNGKSSDEKILPIPKKAQAILVAGSHADNLGYQCGGWTIEWQGGSGRITVGTTILDAIKSTVDPATNVIYSENPDAAVLKSNNFSYAIIVVGETPYAETAGDSFDLTIPEPGPSTIQTVCKSVKCVVVLISGRPVVINPYIPAMDALVAAWLPGTEGQGVADALFGDYGFTGKLSRTWFKSVDQLPMNVGDEHYDPLFPFGFGLVTEPGRA